MFLLAVDTSGKQGGISLARCEAEGCEILESAVIAGGTFSALLVPQIAATLKQHQLKPEDLNALAVVSGPGSFTGLRVGLAAVKGLAEVLNIPIVALSLLELLALSSGETGRVLAVLDAGRKEFYCGEYELLGRNATLIREFLASQEEFLSAVRKFRVVAAEASIVGLLQEQGYSVLQVPRPDTGAAARVGYARLLAGETVSVEDLDANYIRRSDAEIFSKPKIEQQKRSVTSRGEKQ